MVVFRVERTRDFTVMSNYHLRDKNLSLKAKGLLSLMLSLPEDWDYTLSGLARICREGKDAIRGAISELERAGYVWRRQTIDRNGKFSANEYIIRERPVDSEQPEASENQRAERAKATGEGIPLPQPSSGFPTTENPSAAGPSTGFPTEIKKDTRNTDQENTDAENTHSLPIPSAPFMRPVLPVERKERKRRVRDAVMDPGELAEHRVWVRENIEYDELVREQPWSGGQLDELVELMVEAVCSKRPTLRVAGEEIPQGLVRSRLLKLGREHIRYVLDCLERNTTQVRNVRQYLLTTLYNASLTLENGTAAQACHDLRGEAEV